LIVARSAARERRCAAGCGGPSATRVCGPVPQTHDGDRIKRWERENRELRQAIDLRKASAYFAQASSTAVQTMIASSTIIVGLYGVEPICRVLPIAPARFRTHAARRATRPSCQRDPGADWCWRRESGGCSRQTSASRRAQVWRQLGREGIAPHAALWPG